MTRLKALALAGLAIPGVACASEELVGTTVIDGRGGAIEDGVLKSQKELRVR